MVAYLFLFLIKIVFFIRQKTLCKFKRVTQLRNSVSLSTPLFFCEQACPSSCCGSPLTTPPVIWRLWCLWRWPLSPPFPSSPHWSSTGNRLGCFVGHSHPPFPSSPHWSSTGNRLGCCVSHSHPHSPPPHWPSTGNRLWYPCWWPLSPPFLSFALVFYR
jgi:hypothetical protein